MSSAITEFVWNPPLLGIAEGLVDLIDRAVEDGGTLGHDQRMTADQASAFMDALTRRIDRGETDLLVGSFRGIPAMMVLMTRNALPNCRHIAELSKGVVHPRFRGRNLVPLAFEALAERALQHGIEQFVLDVREHSRAHLLWQRFGFTTYGVLEDYARIGGRSHCGHFMVQPVRALADRLARFNPRSPESTHPMLLDKQDFKEALERTLHDHLTLSHPIFRELLDPARPNPDLMRAVALQGYQLTKHFLFYVEHLFFHCPLPRFKRALLINVYEEETGRLSKTDNHVVLMQNLIRALGISDAERDAAVALPATQELIEYRLRAVTNPATYHIGAAAVMIASEGQNLETSAGEARHELLGKVFDLTDDDLAFFSVHQAEDVGHVEQGLNLVSELCRTEAMQQEALQAVDHTCRLFYDMYEGMYRAYCGAAPIDIEVDGAPA